MLGVFRIAWCWPIGGGLRNAKPLFCPQQEPELFLGPPPQHRRMEGSYSSRRAIIGSTLMARRAGTYAASAATEARAIATHTNVSGSLAETPKSKWPSTREVASALIPPRMSPLRNQDKRLARDQPQYRAARSSERYTDADFMRPACNRIGNDSKNSGRRQHQCHRAQIVPTGMCETWVAPPRRLERPASTRYH